MIVCQIPSPCGLVTFQRTHQLIFAIIAYIALIRWKKKMQTVYISGVMLRKIYADAINPKLKQLSFVVKIKKKT